MNALVPNELLVNLCSTQYPINYEEKKYIMNEFSREGIFIHF